MSFFGSIVLLALPSSADGGKDHRYQTHAEEEDGSKACSEAPGVLNHRVVMVDSVTSSELEFRDHIWS